MGVGVITKLKVFIFGNDKSIRVKKVPVKENKVIIEKDWEVNFKPEQIFEHQDRGLISWLTWMPVFPFKNSFHRSLIVREGKSVAETITGEGDMFGPLTIQENADLIKRLIAKSKLTKPMTNLQIILLFGIIGVLILQILTMSGVTFG